MSINLSSIVLFGPSTPTGHSLLCLLAKLYPDTFIHTFSRHPDSITFSSSNICHQYGDLKNPPTINLALVKPPFLIFCIGPIWDFSPFFDTLVRASGSTLQGLLGIIATSSTSAVTKRFSFCSSDQDLVANLLSSESCLDLSCSKLDLPLRIIRPSLIYGSSGGYADKNISVLVRLMRFSPFIILPKSTGMRQPIHCSQLALSLIHFVSNLSCHPRTVTIDVGGDTELTYSDMLRASFAAFIDRNKQSRILYVPNRLFYVCALLVAPFSPKFSAALLRLVCNLSGFKRVSDLLGQPPRDFPLIGLN